MIPKATMKLPNEPGIYMITCTANGKIYIGSTNNLNRRWIGHRCLLNGNRHHNQHLQNAWNKYGEDMFVFTVLEKCLDDKLVEREQYYLDYWKPFDRQGFNIAFDVVAPQLGRTHTPESRKKLSVANKGKVRSAETRERIRAAHLGKKNSPEATAKTADGIRGRKHTPEARAKMSAALKGKKKTPEQIRQMSESRKGIPTGRKHTPETKAKMSAARMGKKLTPEQCAHMGRSRKGVVPVRALEAATKANFGRKATPEHCAKISIALKGRKLSPEHIAKIKAREIKTETRAKLSASAKGRKASPETRAKMSAVRKGRINSEETREKLRGRIKSPEELDRLSAANSKYTYIATSPDGEEIEFHSMIRFCKEHSLTVACMRDVITGRQHHHRGWKVRIVEPPDKEY